MRQYLPVYGGAIMLTLMAFALGIRVGRDNPYPLPLDLKSRFVHLFHHHPTVFDRL